MVNLKDSIKNLKGVGPKREELFHKLGIISGAKIGEKNTFKVKIISKLQNRRIRKGLTLTSFLAEDESGEMEISFFNAFYLNKLIKSYSNLVRKLAVDPVTMLQVLIYSYLTSLSQ